MVWVGVSRKKLETTGKMVGMRKTVYLDSTIPSFMFDERKSMKAIIELTKKWWKEESNDYALKLSDSVIQELSMGEYPNKEKILQFSRKIDLLPTVPDIAEIAKVYIQHHLMPHDLVGDAIHLAFASFYKIDFLLTWNCKHLANANKQNHIRRINVSMDLFTPQITTPMELIREE